MIASLIAYTLCLFCSFLAICSLVLAFVRNGTESLIALALVFVFGVVAWGFAFVGSLT